MSPLPIPLLLAISFFLLAKLPPPATAQQPQTISNFSAANSPWLPTHNQILISPNGTFAAGFRPSSAPDLYIFAVWFQNVTKSPVVWSLDGSVNRSSPLIMSPSGVLSLNDSSGRNLWPKPIGDSNEIRLILNESGKLVFRGWNSFAQPTDTILPNQMLPQPGTSLRNEKFSLVNATFLVFNGSDVYWPPQPQSNPNTIQNLTSDGQLIMSSGPKVAADYGDKPLRRLKLDADGNLRIYSFNSRSGNWIIVWQAVQQLCTIHGICGANSICTPNGIDITSCRCPPGFRRNGNSNSCTRKIDDQQKSKFLRLDFVDFDQVKDQVYELTPLDFSSCQSRCMQNATCAAFSYKFDGTQYCKHHSAPLFNGYWSPGTQLATFIRVAESETDVSNFTGMTSILDTVCPVQISLPVPPKESKTTARNLGIIGTAFTLELLVGVLSFWAFLKKYSKYRDMAYTFRLEFLPAGGPKRFTYAELKAATNNFSNVLGQGGFGIVYKGELPDHRAVAVKCLKNVDSGKPNADSGEPEFWAEISIIARMHHLNLVRMWGFCAEKQQRMLVYEYVPNGSLDKHLFRQVTQVAVADGDQVPHKPLLDWNIRYRIAVGVARAIAYLHEECLEWVLHCDIKPENILLTDDFCPKVSDFGLSKLTNKEEKVKMSKMRGTRGYIAPEWVTQREPITAKADVYSFGMVLLDIVSGIRNNNFRRSSLQSEDCYFPTWAFEKIYEEQKVEDILDERILEIYDSHAHFAMVERMVKTAMWCLQDRPEMRPSMGKVAKMLEGTVEITEPGKPTLWYTGS